MKKIALALIAAGLSGSTAAAPLSAQQILQQFNLIVLGDVSSTNSGQQHVDGRSYIAGNLTGNVAPWGDPQAVYAAKSKAMSESAYAGLTVRGSVSGIQANNNGIVVGGDLTGSIVQNNNHAYPATAAVLGNSTGNGYNVASYVKGSRSDKYTNGGSLASAPATVGTVNSASEFKTTLEGLSSSLSHLYSAPGTSKNFSEAITDTPSYPTTTFHAVATNGVAVINMTSADLGAMQFKFDYGNATTVIINVDGSDVDIGANFLGDNIASILATNTIWNFFNASTVDITGNSFGGTVLAPYAHLTNGNSGNGGTIEGSVLVSSLTQNGEIHTNNFRGDITGLVTNIPEPQTYALMLCGLALMAGIARRRRAA